jgi:allantoicase
MSYPSLGEEIVNAVLFSLLFGLIGAFGGMFWQLFRSALLSLGMIMIFGTWLDTINFDGSWPSNQPVEREFFLRRTKADDSKIWTRIDDNMSERDWADYHHCYDVNVCVRKFAGMRRP